MSPTTITFSCPERVPGYRYQNNGQRHPRQLGITIALLRNLRARIEIRLGLRLDPAVRRRFELPPASVIANILLLTMPLSTPWERRQYAEYLASWDGWDYMWHRYLPLRPMDEYDRYCCVVTVRDTIRRRKVVKEAIRWREMAGMVNGHDNTHEHGL